MLFLPEKIIELKLYENANKLRICQNCSKFDIKYTFAKCIVCKSAHYCSRECQKIDWKEHKKFCIKNEKKIDTNISQNIRFTIWFNIKLFIAYDYWFVCESPDNNKDISISNLSKNEFEELVKSRIGNGSITFNNIRKQKEERPNIIFFITDNFVIFPILPNS